MSGRVVIVGAGILGLSTAYALIELGVVDVHIIDCAVPGAGATGRSGALLRSNYNNRTEVQLAEYSLRFYREFETRIGGPSGFNQIGLLVMVPPEMSADTEYLAEQQCTWGADISTIDNNFAQTLVPFLRCDDVGVILHQPTAGYCDSNTTLSSLYRYLLARGVKFDCNCRVIAVCQQGMRVSGVETSVGFMEADAVVIAAGVWATSLIQDYVDLGLIPKLTRVAVFRPHEFDINGFATIIDNVQDAWFRPMPGGAVLVGSESGVVSGVDLANIPSTAPNELVESYRTVLTRRFAVSSLAAPRGSWAGAFMLSPDYRPIVGALPEIKGLFLIGGDSGGAFKTAPALGLGLAELMTGAPSSITDISDLSPARFFKSCPHIVVGGKTLSS